MEETLSFTMQETYTETESEFDDADDIERWEEGKDRVFEAPQTPEHIIFHPDSGAVDAASVPMLIQYLTDPETAGAVAPVCQRVAALLTVCRRPEPSVRLRPDLPVRGQASRIDGLATPQAEPGGSASTRHLRRPGNDRVEEARNDANIAARP